MSKQTTNVFKEATKAINKIKATIPQLTESEKATLELLLDREAQVAILKSREEIKRGNFITLDELKKQL